MKYHAFLGLFLLSAACWSQPQTISEMVTKNKIEAHIGFLASDALRGRDTGSPELKIAAEYIKSQFRTYGVRPVEPYADYLQPVPFSTIPASTTATIQFDTSSFRTGEDALLMAGKSGSWSAEMVFVDYGTTEDFEGKEVEGKIVVAICGGPGVSDVRGWLTLSTEKRQRAEENGALGVIELYNNQQTPWSLLTRYLRGDRTVIDEAQDSQGFTLWVNDSNNANIEVFKAAGEGSISIDGGSRQFISQNVVGFIEGTDPNLKDEYVVYSAHYDHVGVGRPDAEGDSIYNGARDNAAGTVTVLSMAEYFAKYPPKRSALFVLFTAEEKGLLGSRYFVANSPVELSQIVYCFNSDNGGYNDTSLTSIIGFERTTAQEDIGKACEAFGLKAIEDPAKEQGLFDRSDNVNFAAVGIPAPTFSMGFTAFDAEIARYYHQPGDEPETLDYEYLLKFFRSYVYTGLLIANREERPFWIEGDKYYEAGKQLYDGQ